jgi:glucosamine--fructose-6-phosphate aminotransferase (isomerizing)
MCGIVGFTGAGSNADALVSGLKRLEYRGYDSAGICLVSDEGFLVSKAVGKVSELEKAMPSQAREKRFAAGIAHTRWATHGGVTENNAHPHLSKEGRVAIVHNGIIDNAEEIRAQLEGLGYPFKSETDSEVAAHLIEYYLNSLTESGGKPHTAVVKALEKLRGTYGLAILFRDAPGLLIVARMGSPLVVGLSDGKSYVASDTSAIARYTNRVVYLEDGDILEVLPGSVSSITTDKAPVVREIDIQDVIADMGKYDSYMLKEIAEQPSAIRRCFGGRIRENTCVLGGFNLEDKSLSKVTSVGIIGCGTSYHAGLLGSHLIEKYAGIPSRVHIASEFANKRVITDANGLYLAISQSGETYDTLECIRELRNKDCDVYGIVNVVGSTIARTCGRGVYIHAGPEVAVASTKAFTSQFAALCMFAIMLGRAKELDAPTGQRLCQALSDVPPIMEAILESPADDSKKLPAIAALLAESKYVLFLGRGLSYPVAMEGALKLREIAYVPCEAYAGGEMKHGPIAMIEKGTPVIAIVPTDENLERMIGNIKEVQARGARVIAIRDLASSYLPCDDEILIPYTEPDFTPFITTPILQLLAYYAAKHKGLDIDKPRNLAKSVTVG